MVRYICIHSFKLLTVLCSQREYDFNKRTIFFTEVLSHYQTCLEIYYMHYYVGHGVYLEQCPFRHGFTIGQARRSPHEPSSASDMTRGHG